MLHPRAPRASRGGDAEQPPRPDIPPQPGRSPPPLVPRFTVSPPHCHEHGSRPTQGQMPPRLQPRRDGERREGAPRSPFTGAQVRGLLGWAPDRRGAGKAAASPHKDSPAPVPAPLTSARRQPRRSFSAPRPRTQTTPLIAVPASLLRLRAGAAAAAPSRCLTEDVVHCSALDAHCLLIVNYISLKAPRGPAPFGRALVPARPAQPRPAAAAAAWGVWNVRRPPERPRGGAGAPGHRSRHRPQPLHLSAPLLTAREGGSAMQCSAVQCNAAQRSAVLSHAVPGGIVQCGKEGSFH